MKSKRKVRLYLKFILLILCLIVIIQIFSLTLSRYESNSTGNADIDIAFYVLNENYQSMPLNLGKIVPRSEPYIYHFTISNEENDYVAETDIEYDLQIKTTTNLPLEFKLYRNETDEEAITENIIEKDQDGTYFRTLKTEKQLFHYSTPRVDEYTLVVTFPEIYNTENYQDILEVIWINVDASQVVEENGG